MTVKYSDRKIASAYLELLRAVHVGISEMGVPMAHQIVIVQPAQRGKVVNNLKLL